MGSDEMVMANWASQLRSIAKRVSHIASKIEDGDAKFALLEVCNDCLRSAHELRPLPKTT